MACERFTAQGMTFTACCRGQRAKKPKMCSVCERRESTKQCDGPPPKRAKRATCDAYLCDECAVHVGDDTDHCPDCAKRLAIPARPEPYQPELPSVR